MTDYTANFYQFSWQTIPEFYWYKDDDKFKDCFTGEPKDWCSKVIMAISSYEYQTKKYLLIHRWKALVAGSQAVTCGRYEKYALTCNDRM